MGLSTPEQRPLAGWDHALLEALWRQPVHDSFRMLLLRDMCLIAGQDGRVPIKTLAQRFRNFFRKRSLEGKHEERDDVSSAEPRLCEQSIEWWEHIILEQPYADLKGDLLLHEGEDLLWISELWTSWSTGFRKALRNTAETRLIEYFEIHVEGGW
jgi:hypothetical protein